MDKPITLQPKLTTVVAIQWTGNNLLAVKKFVHLDGGVVMGPNAIGTIDVETSQGHRFWVLADEWIMRDEGTLIPYSVSDRLIQDKYDRAEEAETEEKDYPSKVYYKKRKS